MQFRTASMSAMLASIIRKVPLIIIQNCAKFRFLGFVFTWKLCDKQWIPISSWGDVFVQASCLKLRANSLFRSLCFLPFFILSWFTFLPARPTNTVSNNELSHLPDPTFGAELRIRYLLLFNGPSIRSAHLHMFYGRIANGVRQQMHLPSSESTCIIWCKWPINNRFRKFYTTTFIFQK